MPCGRGTEAGSTPRPRLLSAASIRPTAPSLQYPPLSIPLLGSGYEPSGGHCPDSAFVPGGGDSVPGKLPGSSYRSLLLVGSPGCCDEGSVAGGGEPVPGGGLPGTPAGGVFPG